MEEVTINNIGFKIRVLRRIHGISQEFLSLESGIDKKTVHRIENEECIPNLKTALKILQTLNTKIYYSAN